MRAEGRGFGVLFCFSLWGLVSWVCPICEGSTSCISAFVHFLVCVFWFLKNLKNVMSSQLDIGNRHYVYFNFNADLVISYIYLHVSYTVKKRYTLQLVWNISLVQPLWKTVCGFLRNLRICQMIMEPLGSNAYRMKVLCFPSTNFPCCQFIKHATEWVVIAPLTHLLYNELNMVKYTHFLMLLWKWYFLSY